MGHALKLLLNYQFVMAKNNWQLSCGMVQFGNNMGVMDIKVWGSFLGKRTYRYRVVR